MRRSVIRSFVVAIGMAAFGMPLSVSAQAGGPQASQGQGPAPVVRRLSVDEAVRLATENNLGIQLARFEPQIEDLNLAQVRASYVPSVTSTFQSSSRTQPNRSFLAGAVTANEDTFINNTGVLANLPWGGSYEVGWNSSRYQSNDLGSTFNPSLSSTVSARITQPLLRNLKIDNIRQQLQITQINRDIADLQLREQVLLIARNVRNAYWNLAYQHAALEVARQSLELARESLRNTRARVEIGTTPPIDVVADEAEVAAREEAVIVAEAEIATGEESLRALIYDPSMPDFWQIRIEPDALPAFQPVDVDLQSAIDRALAQRSDVQQVRRSLDITDVNIEFQRNQTLPDVSAQFDYRLAGVGGRQIQRGEGPFGPGTGEPIGFNERSFGAVLGDVFRNDYPTWTAGVTISYPIGRSQQEAALARARLQRTQTQTQLRNTQMQIETEIRQRARQVMTNQQRVQTTRASRELQERRLEAEQRKFAAGTSTNFQVFQAQRDLAVARNSELRAILDYNQSLVDFATAQEVPVR